MTFEQFKAAPTEPVDLSPALRALWHDSRGDFDRAHGIAQDVDDEACAWVHAYLHREEGDPGNAAYWYRRARKPVADDSLGHEWERIVRALLARQAAPA